TPSDASQAAGRQYMKRLESRAKDRDIPVSRNSAVAQLAAIREWGVIPSTNRYGTLKNITQETLIVHGNKDVVVAPINALILAERLPNAQLVVYSDFESWSPISTCRDILATCEPVLDRGEFSVS